MNLIFRLLYITENRAFKLCIDKARWKAVRSKTPYINIKCVS